MVINKISKAIKEKPLVAFICNTSDKHLTTAIPLAKNNIHLFIEKPVGIQKNKIKSLIKICKNKNIINMVGYMMRFHPAITLIKKIISDKKNWPFFILGVNGGNFCQIGIQKKTIKKVMLQIKKWVGI